MWIARDSDDVLCIYKHKPSKGKKVWIESSEDRGPDGMYIISEDYFPEIKWEDEEPRELILKPIKEE